MTDATADDRDGQLETATSRALIDRGLTGPAFDLDTIVADVRSRLDADASLDDLIGRDQPS